MIVVAGAAAEIKVLKWRSISFFTFNLPTTLLPLQGMLSRLQYFIAMISYNRAKKLPWDRKEGAPWTQLDTSNQMAIGWTLTRHRKWHRLKNGNLFSAILGEIQKTLNIENVIKQMWLAGEYCLNKQSQPYILKNRNKLRDVFYLPNK